MLMSKLVGKTSKKIEDEFNIESQKLLLRAGMFRSVSPGTYSVLPIGKKVVDKLVELLSNELEKKDFQNAFIPPKEEFERTVSLALRNDMKSYKDLPKAIYDVSNLEREKIKGKDGILKSKNYTSLRTMTFFKNEEAVVDGYKNMMKLYRDKLEETGISIVSRASYNYKNPLGKAEELLFECENGEREIYSCKKCGYSALNEMANFYVEDCEIEDKELEPVHTPDIKTIKELVEFMDIDAGDLAKTLLVKAGREVVAVIIRGNRELNIYKLSKLLGVPLEDIQMADYEDIDGKIETVPGFVGPVELEGVRLIVDREVTKAGPLITGANKRDYHLKNVIYNREFVGDIVADVSYVREEDKCLSCGEGLTKEHGIDIGKVLSLGRITDIKNMEYKNVEGKPQSIYGVSSHIDIYKLLSSIVEKYHDDDGIIWPVKIAPYHVIVSILNIKNEDQVELGKKLYHQLKEQNISVILDDRKERAGAKFYDADLLGIPIRIVVAKGAAENKVEFKLRWDEEKEELSTEDAMERVFEVLGKKS